MTSKRSAANACVYVAVHPSEIQRAETTLAQSKNLVDQRLCAEDDREGEALGVFCLGFGRVDHDA